MSSKESSVNRLSVCPKCGRLPKRYVYREKGKRDMTGEELHAMSDLNPMREKKLETAGGDD